jgi:hypothetical protein
MINNTRYDIIVNLLRYASLALLALMYQASSFLCFKIHLFVELNFRRLHLRTVVASRHATKGRSIVSESLSEVVDVGYYTIKQDRAVSDKSTDDKLPDARQAISRLQ